MDFAECYRVNTARRDRGVGPGASRGLSRQQNGSTGQRDAAHSGGGVTSGIATFGVANLAQCGDGPPLHLRREFRAREEQIADRIKGPAGGAHGQSGAGCIACAVRK
jgi:hypothetical protein